MISKVLASTAMAVALLVGITSCSRVEPGHVGIKVSNFGSSSGVSDQSLGVGYYLAAPGTTIYEYPVYTNTYTWTQDETERAGKYRKRRQVNAEQIDTDESFNFQDKNGLGLNADISIAYRVDPRLAPKLFQKYRTDMSGIVAGAVRNAVRNAVVQESSLLGVEEIYGPKKAQLIASALANVQKYFKPFGLEVEQMYWASNVRVPAAVLKQINQKIANEQAALAAQASVATAEADARSRVAAAEGTAKAMEIEAAAISTNPAILQLRAIQKWDGKYPTYMAGSMPLPTMGVR